MNEREMQEATLGGLTTAEIRELETLVQDIQEIEKQAVQKSK